MAASCQALCPCSAAVEAGQLSSGGSQKCAAFRAPAVRVEAWGVAVGRQVERLTSRRKALVGEICNRRGQVGAHQYQGQLSWRIGAASESTEAGTATTGYDDVDEQDMQDVKDVLRILEVLKGKRDMAFNEVRLSIMIEDPREAERRKQLGIDNESGCTREELAAALVDINEGRVPADKMALRALADEMRAWPRLEDEDDGSPLGKKKISPYAKVTPTGVDPKLAAKRAGVDVDWDAAAEVSNQQEEKSLGEILPSWMGYSVLYGISSLPIIIGVVVVIILFLNSLQ